MVVEKVDAVNLESCTLFAILKWVYLITAVRVYGLTLRRLMSYIYIHIHTWSTYS